MPSDKTDKAAKKTTRAPRKRTAATVSEVPTAATAPANGDDKYAPQAWGSTSVYEDLRVPSGQLCLARRPGLEGLMKAGIVSNFDLLTKIIGDQSERIKTGKEPKTDAEVTAEIMEDPERMAEMMRVINKIIMHVVVKPVITPAPNDMTQRKPGVIYDDMVELEDKMFILNFAVGGVRDLETFRGQYETALRSVDDQPEVGSAAQ
jgi:hypothetical protein